MVRPSSTAGARRSLATAAHRSTSAALRRVAVPPHDRVDAIGRDEQPTRDPAVVTTRTLVHEGCLDTIGPFIDRREMVPGVQTFGTDAVERGFEKHLLKHPAMDGDLRPFLSGFESASLTPDQLAAFGEIGQCRRRQPPRLELRASSKLIVPRTASAAD